MELCITLAPDGGLRLILPTGRPLDVGCTEASLRFIQRILMDQRTGKKQQRGHVQDFPTQHVIEIWRREDLRKNAEAAKEREAAKLAEEKERFEDMGIDLETLDISL